MNQRDALIALLLKLKALHPLGSIFSGTIEEALLPPDFAALVTKREPWRSRVLADAPIFFAVPCLHGIGLEIRLPVVLPLIPGEDGEVAIAPLRAELVWSVDMSGQSTESGFYTLARVVWEDQTWKIAELWEPDVRESTLAVIGRLRSPQPGGSMGGTVGKAGKPVGEPEFQQSDPRQRIQAMFAADGQGKWGARAVKFLVFLYLLAMATMTSFTVNVKSQHSWRMEPGTRSEKAEVYWVWPGFSFGSTRGMPMLGLIERPLFTLLTPGFRSATIRYDDSLECLAAPATRSTADRTVTISRTPTTFITKTRDIGSTIEVRLGGYLW